MHGDREESALTRRAVLGRAGSAAAGMVVAPATERTDWAATGRNENGFTYTTSERLKRIHLSAARGTANRRIEADRPATDLMVGEGAALYHEGIPGMHITPLPSYLARVSKDGELSKLSKRLFYGQLESFAKAMTALDRTPTDRIGALLPPANA